MYGHILLLMDCSEVDETILRHVGELARHHGSKVHLFHVIHAHTRDQRRALRSSAADCLERANENLKSMGIDVSYSVAEGEPPEEVLSRIEGSDFDLVAMATHGHRGIGDLVLGSVSRTLKHSITIPILIVRGGS
jgi:nucleotide-binding universal stress UspA family protein